MSTHQRAPRVRITFGDTGPGTGGTNIEATPWRFTVDDYRRLGDAGILADDARVELIEGEIIAMSPIGVAHAATVGTLASVLGRFGGQAVLWVQNPIQIGRHSEPQPDLALLRSRDDGYRRSLPRVSDVLFLIEVSDSSLSFDRSVKIPMYATAGIAEVFIVDLPQVTIERHSGPAGLVYDSVTVARAGETLQSTVLAELTLRVDEVFGLA